MRTFQTLGYFSRQVIEAAFETLRDGGHAPATAYCEAQLPKARALVERLTKDGPKNASAKP